MRKVRGYIGAIIILFALMGSILAGYALNVSGQSVIINDYEPVTDVSGLYDHSQERTYIEYNPASNYIGYGIITETYDNTSGTNEYRILTDSVVKYRGSDRHQLIDDVDQGAVSVGRFNILSDKFYIYQESNGLTLYRYDGPNVIASLNDDATFTVSGDDVTISMGGNSYTINDNAIILARATIETDYYMSLSNTKNNVYLNDINQVLFSGYVGKWGIIHGTTWRGMGSYTGQTETIDLFNGRSSIVTGIDVYSSIGGNSDGFQTWAIFYPKSVTTGSGLGIDYTESNRVNNYPIITDPGNVTHTDSTINLMGVSASDHWEMMTNYQLSDPSNNRIASSIFMFTEGHNTIIPPFYGNHSGIPHLTLSGSSYINDINVIYHNYRLIDIIASQNLPNTVSQVTINTNSSDIRDLEVFDIGSSDSMGYYNIDANMAFITTPDSWNTTAWVDHTIITVEGGGLRKDYAIYNINAGNVDIYRYDGVKKSTVPINDVYITFLDNTARYASAIDAYYQPDGVHIEQKSGYMDLGGRANPILNISYDIVNPESIEYMDITKGFSIDPNNITSVLWNNTYENGDIKILFRAPGINQTYSNTLTVSDNDISIEYRDNRFYISLNNGEEIDIGTWRNIILDIDLINGKLSAIPVRTFNSFVNVNTDNTNITIGDLVNAQPVNAIYWGTTTNSLLFNVYLTSVFMNTYGVVMVNPSLNITDYFTDLNNFYRLDLSDFSIYGDSITVNGVTGTVTDNIMTIGDTVLMIKNLAITYADGYASIEDNNYKIDLGPIVDNTISMTGNWYFNTDLLRGFTTQKQVYDWNWSDFILDNTQFCLIYAGLAIAGLIVARKFATLSTIDYIVLITSFIIAFSMQVIA